MHKHKENQKELYMKKINDITKIAEYLSQKVKEGKLSLNNKNTLNFDALLEIIYSFIMKTKRKDGKTPGDRPQALIIACQKLIYQIKKEHNIP